MKVNRNAVPRRNSDAFIEKIIDDEIVLYDKSTNEIHNLNMTAAVLWNLCDGEADLNEIVHFALEHFQGDGSAIEEEVIQALDRMKSLGLINF